MISAERLSKATDAGTSEGVAAEWWRCGRGRVVRERPALLTSWTLAVAGTCLVVALVGLTRPVGDGFGRVMAVREVATDKEVPMVELAASAEPAWGGAVESSVVVDAESLGERVERLPEPAVALTVDDVFVIPAAAAVEPLMREERKVPERTPAEPVGRPTTAARKSVGSTSGPGAGATEGSGPVTTRSGGKSEGEGGRGAAVAGAGRGAGYFPAPFYPAQARSRGQQGTVQLTIVFGSDGRVTSASVRRSSGYTELDRAAAQWVRRHWRAAAGQVGTFRLPVHFKLR